jgi:hypothetical protein
LAAVGAVAASRISAESATDVERIRQDGLRESRRSDEALRLAVRFLRTLEQRMQQLEEQVASRQEVARSGGDPDSVAELKGSTTPMRNAAAALFLVARQSTADRAVDTYNAINALNASYAHVAARHRKGNLIVRLEPNEYHAYQQALTATTFQKTRFINEVRGELGLSPLS